MKVSIICFFLINLFIAAHAQVELRLLEGETYLRKGRVSKVTFISKDQSFLSEIKKSNGNISLNEWLYLLGVEFVQDNTNNLHSVGATIILKEIPSSTNLTFSLADKNYALSLVNISFHPDDAALTPKGSIINERFSLNKLLLWLKENNKILGLSIVLLCLGLIIFLKKFFSLREIKKAKSEKIARYKDAIKNASTRKDIEELYKCRRAIETLLSHVNSQDFFKYLNSIQYSKDWTEEEFHIIREKLETLKKQVL